MKLSVVLAARNDNYGDSQDEGIYNLRFKPITNLQRIRFCLKNNFYLLNSVMKNDFEIILVDWSPIDRKFLYKDEELSQLNLKHIIVEKSAVKSRKLNQNSFYEYFAKNVGIRRALGDYILVMNSDGFFNEAFVQELNSQIEDLSDSYLRPYSRMDVSEVDPIKVENEGKTLLPGTLEGELGTAGAGDFLLAHNNHWIRAQGFNESESKPYSNKLRQSGLDGQMCMQFFLNNISIKVMQNSIYSIDHNKFARDSREVPKSTYINDVNWGMSDRKMFYINDMVRLIK
jgi:glycosyltransferase involved in cell wall biosynthesis